MKEPKDLEAAVRGFERFNALDPKQVGIADVVMPKRVYCVGEAVNVSYRSRKRDPETLKAPKKSLDYIHEHEGGVHVYRPDARVGRPLEVPEWISAVESVYLLGRCLGFEYLDENGEVVEAEGQSPFPELYSIPSGKALLVIEGKQHVLALIWGGGLDVKPEGIIG